MAAEAILQKQILKALKDFGVLHWRQNLGGVRLGKGGHARNPMKGFPDIAGLHNGVFFTIEVKGPTGKLSKEQESWIDSLRQHGAWHLTAKNLESVLEFLKALNSGKTFRGIL